MIACLRGELFSRSEDRLIIMCGGVGYELVATASCLASLPEIGHQVLVHVHTHVREDAILLFGFADEEEKEIFLYLISVSGVGPKLALAILSGISPSALSEAISGGSIARLTKISGVGKKTAERLCLELKDKLRWHPTRRQLAPRAADPGEELARDTISALVNLGYPESRAAEAVSRVVEKADGSITSLETLIKSALRELA